MFGIANQLLAVIALALVTTLLVNSGRGKYAPVTLLPMLFVIATTMTAGVQMCNGKFIDLIRQGQVLTGALSLAMTIFVITCVGTLLILAVSRWVLVAKGLVPIHAEPPATVHGRRSDGTLEDRDASESIAIRDQYGEERRQS